MTRQEIINEAEDLVRTYVPVPTGLERIHLLFQAMIFLQLEQLEEQKVAHHIEIKNLLETIDENTRQYK